MTRFFSLLAIVALFAACGGPEGQAVEAGEAEAVTEMVASAQYVVDPAASVVNWEGAKLAGTHTGTIPVSDGQIMIADGQLVGGKFTMDLRKLTNTDMPAEEGGDKLVGHLMSQDFFHVDSFPMADFVITQVQPAAEGTGYTHEISGNLTMKGQSRNVTIPANVSMEGDMLKASTPKFVIDRQQWGMTYGASSIAGIAADKVINDEVGLEIMLVANK